MEPLPAEAPQRQHRFEKRPDVPLLQKKNISIPSMFHRYLGILWDGGRYRGEGEAWH